MTAMDENNIMDKNAFVESCSRLMLLVPHEDDEVLMAAGVIRRAVKAGKTVDVVMATNGDYGCRDFSVGRKRLQESLRALALLGLGAEHFHILGYADTGMPAGDSFLTHLYQETDGGKIYPSACSGETYGLLEKPEYHMEKHGVHARYCREDFCSDLKEIILEIKPDCILTTSEYDLHGDHSALACFTREVLGEIRKDGGFHGEAPQLYAALVHSCAGDEHWPDRDRRFYDCPGGLSEKGGLLWEERVRIPVPEEMLFEKKENNLKYQALLCYDTALEPNAREFLMAFIKEEEIFWKTGGEKTSWI